MTNEVCNVKMGVAGRETSHCFNTSLWFTWSVFGLCCVCVGVGREETYIGAASTHHLGYHIDIPVLSIMYRDVGVTKYLPVIQ